MTRDELIDLLRSADPLTAGGAVAHLTSDVVTYSREPAPDSWLVDGRDEGDLAAHRAAHDAGRPSEATVAYGSGVTPEEIADRLLGLREVSAVGNGLLKAVCPVPREGAAARPGSWGMEDVAVIAAARVACPDVPFIRPDWRRLGAGTCQVATHFGANDWQIPPADTTDPELLAAAVGRTAVAR